MLPKTLDPLRRIRTALCSNGVALRRRGIVTESLLAWAPAGTAFDGLSLPHANPYDDCRNSANPLTPTKINFSGQLTLPRPGHGPCSRCDQAVGTTFAFKRNRFVGSYLFLSFTSRG